MTRQAQRGSQLRRAPKQSRAVETCSNVLEAAAELFASRGYEPTTTHQIAARAGVSVGALYRYFADKEAILIELYRQEVSGLRNRVLANFQLTDLISKDVPSLVRKTLVLALRLYSERADLRRVLEEQSRKVPELIALRRQQERQVHQTVKQIFAAAPGVRLPDVDAAAYLVTLFMESFINDRVFRSRDCEGLDDERTVEAAVDFVVRYAMGKVD